MPRPVIGPGPGRPKGSLNKATREFQRACRKLLEDKDYRDALKKRLLAGTLKPQVEVMLHHYAYGKPKETIDVNHMVQEDVTALQELTPEQLAAEAQQTSRELLELQALEQQRKIDEATMTLPPSSETKH